MTKQRAVPALSEGDVADYLRRHPDFFRRHEHLLAELILPHPGIGGAVSLVERQIGILREQEQTLKRKLQTLAQVARGNEQLLQRMQRLLIEVIDTPDLDRCLERLQATLKEDFYADAVVVRLIAAADREGPEFIPADSPSLLPLQRVLKGCRPVCGYLSPEQLNLLFGERAAEMASGVLIPLCESNKSASLGLVGLGSIDPKRFHPEMGTVFLSHLGAVLARVVAIHLRH